MQCSCHSCSCTSVVHYRAQVVCPLQAEALPALLSSQSSQQEHSHYRHHIALVWYQYEIFLEFVTSADRLFTSAAVQSIQFESAGKCRSNTERNIILLFLFRVGSQWQ